MSIPCALTIAGSDSSGGAGIQADLKTFAALGVHGASVITAITSQSTKGISSVLEVKPSMVRSQMRSVLDDLRIDAIKIGMLYSEGIVRVVAEELGKLDIPVVVDPVLTAKCGTPLLRPSALPLFKRLIVPLATVITPNIYEVRVLTGTTVKKIEDAVKASEVLSELGAKSVVVKGGHLPTKDEVTDLLYVDGETTFFKHKRIKTSATHGTGCCFSSAIAAGLAKGKSIKEAVKSAEDFIIEAIRFGLSVGHGYGLVNPSGNPERRKVLKDMSKAVETLEDHPEVADLVPEVQMNIAMAIPQARSIDDVVAIPGRIVRIFNRVKASSHPTFGGSRHVARALLTAMRYDRSMMAAMNIRYSKTILDVCGQLGFSRSFCDRKREPKKVREVEGASTSWAVEEAIKAFGGNVPDVIHLTETVGKESIILVFGRSSTDVVTKVLKIAGRLRS